MDLINHTMEIKQEDEKLTEFDETISAAYINPENVNTHYEVQCDSIKVEEGTLNKENVAELTVKHEDPWLQTNDKVFEAEIEGMKKENSMIHYVDPAQLAEESDHNIKSMSPTCDSILQRVKAEPPADYGDEGYPMPDGGKVKMENQLAIDIKCEKLDGMKSEDLDASQLNAELDVKCEIDLKTMADPSLDSAAKKKTRGKGAQVDEMAAGRALFICYNCNFTARTKTRLIQHVGVGKCHLKANSAKSRLAYTRQNPRNVHVCTHCNKVFRKKPTLHNHIIKKHVESIGSVSSKIHECTHCNYKTIWKHDLNRHTLTHVTAADMFSTCKHCNASFKSEQSLDHHIIKKHPDFIAAIGKEIHECSNCTYKTTFLPHFTKHTKIHSTDMVNTCEHCNATFKWKVSLDNHIVKKHPHFSASVSYTIHQCPSCDYKAARKHHIDRHMLKHLDANPRDVCKHCSGRHRTPHKIKKLSDLLECSYCPFKTAYKRCFDEHMMSHSDVESELNACKHCTATFTRKSNLDDHIVKKHPDFIASVSRKIHECSHCTYKTVRKDILDAHILRHHC